MVDHNSGWRHSLDKRFRLSSIEAFEETTQKEPLNCGIVVNAKRQLHQTVGFYSLRRTHETVASETKDQPAIDLSMGHGSPDMASLYRQRLGDDRLEAVAKHVRKWLSL